MIDVRDTVIRALDRSSGLLSDPELARLAFGGHDLDLGRLELDSLGRFEVMMQLEEKLGIEIDDDEVDRLSHLNQLVDLINSRLQAA